MTDLQDNQQSRNPELQEEVSGIAMSLAAAMAFGLQPEKATAELHRRLKEILKWEGLSPGQIAFLRGKIEKWPPGYAERWASGYAAGLAQGLAKGTLAVLEVRRLSISDDVRERITTCTDHARLDDWLDRAGTVERAEDLFRAGAELDRE
ncbi:hypothetical protein [Streptomyces sp. NBC_00878]|uniref:hypothetical protein n=1 Tax=Streptomyces sp. NBC_00878 TaxID=2975854 RepID=UPI0022565F47|nr:hypothetical protein [Streptomyces sp. NBC_00878]MCX4908153.1 hypothetical protein [Streptomyces sp. NBC_00878]